VRDDGIGFTHAPGAIGETHVGLRIMRERAERIDGSLRVESAPDSGTTVTLVVPIGKQGASGPVPVAAEGISETVQAE